MPNRGDKPYAATLGAVGAAAMVAVAGLTLALAQRRRRYVWQHTLVKPTDRCTLLNARPSSASHAVCSFRPVYSSQEWDEALQEDGAISGFEDIVEQIEQRVSLCISSSSCGDLTSCTPVPAPTRLVSSAQLSSCS
jgi:hypothetical protein